MHQEGKEVTGRVEVKDEDDEKVEESEGRGN